MEYQYCVYKTYEKVFFLLEEYGGDNKGLNLDFLDHFTMSEIDFSKDFVITSIFEPLYFVKNKKIGSIFVSSAILHLKKHGNFLQI